MKPINATDNLCVHVVYRPIDDDGKRQEYAVARCGKNRLYLDEDHSYLFTKREVIYVDDVNRDIMVGKRRGGFYRDQFDNYIRRESEWFANFIFKWQGIFFSKIFDTVVDGKSYKVLLYVSKHTYRYNPATGVCDLPSFHDVYYYCNPETKRVEYICALPSAVADNQAWKEELWLDYDFDFREEKYLDIFDTGSAKYKDYSFHDDTNPPLSRSVYHTGKPELTDTVLYYPLVTSEGDTTSIAEMEGWLLLDCWAFRCRGCYEWLQSVDRERRSPQGFALDSAGIRVLSINALSDNLEKIRELAIRFNAESFVYSAKGLSAYLEMHILPRNYLISPDKKMVYDAYELGDYLELLEAKRKYEETRTDWPLDGSWHKW